MSKKTLNDDPTIELQLATADDMVEELRRRGEIAVMLVLSKDNDDNFYVSMSRNGSAATITGMMRSAIENMEALKEDE